MICYLHSSCFQTFRRKSFESFFAIGSQSNRQRKSELMRQVLLVIICLLFFAISSLAQTSETFDIATFQSPRNWQRQASQNSIQLSTEDKAKGTYCLITLFKSLP